MYSGDFAEYKFRLGKEIPEVYNVREKGALRGQERTPRRNSLSSQFCWDLVLSANAFTASQNALKYYIWVVFFISSRSGISASDHSGNNSSKLTQIKRPSGVIMFWPTHWTSQASAKSVLQQLTWKKKKHPSGLPCVSNYILCPVKTTFTELYTIPRVIGQGIPFKELLVYLRI